MSQEEMKDIMKKAADYESETFWEIITAIIKVFALGGLMIYFTNIIGVIYQTLICNTDGTAEVMLIKLIPGIMLILLCFIMLVIIR